jgi:hypothetical protein
MQKRSADGCVAELVRWHIMVFCYLVVLCWLVILTGTCAQSPSKLLTNPSSADRDGLDRVKDAIHHGQEVALAVVVCFHTFDMFVDKFYPLFFASISHVLYTIA